MSSSSNRGEGGFTLVEVMVCSLILTIGMLAIAGLLAVTTQMHVAAREAARSTRLAQDKLDALMRLDFDTADEIAVGGSLDDDDPNHFDPDAPDGISVRWLVETHPDGIADLRVLTVHVQNRRAQTFGRDVELTTIIRNW